MAEQHRDNMPVIHMMNKIEEYFDDNGNWRLRIVAGTKFNEMSRGIFLREMAEHGRKSTAAMAAGVSVTTANWAIKNDADFNEAVAHCQLIYHDRIIAHHQDLLFNGIEKRRYDNKGMVIETIREYPIRLIELELKKHDDGYRDKREINMNVSGGVLVAPAGITIEEWEKKHGETVEGEFTEAEVKSSVEKAVIIAEE